jgi:hypothetical protein
VAEYKKHVIGEATKGVTAGAIGALLLFAGQQWLSSDLEFRVASRDAYLSAPLGQQGLAMSFGGKPLDNVSVVEFSIINRTPKQFSNADLVFTVNSKSPPALVAGGVIPPHGMSAAETVEELQSKDSAARKFRLKVVPKQRDAEYFHAVFVFDGENAPSMSISSASGEASIVPYQQWKDTTTALLSLLGIVFLFVAGQVLLMSLVDYFWEPRKHKNQVERFVAHANQMSKAGELQSADPMSQVDAGAIYASFTRPKPSKFWSKLLPDQRFEY